MEHETGLEILFIASAVGTLIQLLPMIGSGWKWLKRRFSHDPFDERDGGGIEIRQLNMNNVLVEQQVQSVELYVLNAGLQENARLKERVRLLEEKLEGLEQPKRPKGKSKTLRTRKKAKKK